jgi:hypothetical protein
LIEVSAETGLQIRCKKYMWRWDATPNTYA